MNPSLGKLRSAMHQRVELTTKHLLTPSYFEEFKTRSFKNGDIAERYHENSRYVNGLMEKPERSVGEFTREAMQFVQANLAIDYPGHKFIQLPSVETNTVTDFSSVLASRRSTSAFRADNLSINTLSQLLDSVGVTKTLAFETDDGSSLTKPVRAYPSAGALYPVEIYPVILNCPELPMGVYYYVAERHGLRALRTKEPDIKSSFFDALVLGETDHELTNAAVYFVLTGVFWRSKAKYGPRGYRYVLQESGHVAQNIQLSATSLGLASVPIGGFYDDRVNQVLGVNCVDEATLYLIAIGATKPEGSS